MRYYIEAEVRCVRLLEIDADSETQATALAEDYMADHMADADAHSVTTRKAERPAIAEDIGERLTAVRKDDTTERYGYDPNSYYGYDFAEESER